MAASNLEVLTNEVLRELVERILGIKHKIKVYDSMKPSAHHEEISGAQISRWELEDELMAIERILSDDQQKRIKIKQTEIEKSIKANQPIKKKKKK